MCGGPRRNHPSVPRSHRDRAFGSCRLHTGSSRRRKSSGASRALRAVQQAGRRVDGGVTIDLPLSREGIAPMTGTMLYTVSRITSGCVRTCHGSSGWHRAFRSVQRGRDPVLLEAVEAIVGELSAELGAHMRRKSWCEAPVAVLEQEHDRAGALLAELRGVTGGCTLPD